MSSSVDAASRAVPHDMRYDAEVAVQGAVGRAAVGQWNDLAFGAVQGAREIASLTVHTPASLDKMICIGGLTLVISSILSILNVFGVLSPLSYIMNFYLVAFGCITIMSVERPFNHMPAFVQTRLKRTVHFFQSHSSRAAFYFLVAAIEGSYGGIVNTVTGWYFAAIGVVFAYLRFKHGPLQSADSQGVIELHAVSAR